MNIGSYHEVYFLDEIFNGSCFPLSNKRLRITGKLENYNPVTCIAQVSDPERRTKETLSVYLGNVDNVPFIEGNLFQFFGELVEKEKNLRLVATTARNVDGLDVQMFREAIKLRRNYLSKST